MKAVVELITRHDLGAGTSVGPDTAGEESVELARSRAVRYDDVGADLRPTERGYRVTKSVQIRNANEPRPARSDHLSCGGRSSV